MLPKPCEQCLVRHMMYCFPEALVITDAEDRILLISREAEQLLGLQEKEVLFQPLQKHLQQTSLAQFWQTSLALPRVTRASVWLGEPPMVVNASSSPFACSNCGRRGRFLLLSRPLEQLLLQQELVRTMDHFSPGMDTADPYGPLTPQEKRVLALLAEGLSNAEIARRLQITGNTVGTHVRRIYRKLGIHSRSEAAHLVLLHSR